MRTCLLGLVLAFTAVASAQQTPPPAGRPVRSGPSPASQPARVEAGAERRATSPRLAPSQALDAIVDEVLFEQTPLDIVLESLKDRIDANFVIHWDVIEDARVDRNTPISLRMRNVSGRAALQTVLRLATVDEPLGFEVSSKGIVVSSVRELDATLETRVYDVTELMMVDDHPFTIDFGGGPLYDPYSMGFEVTGEVTSVRGIVIRPTQEGDPRKMAHSDANIRREIRARQLVDCIVTLEPTHFEENGGPGRVTRFRNYVVVRAAPRIHQLIGKPVNIDAGVLLRDAEARPPAQPSAP